jgi:hypothetical protein
MKQKLLNLNRRFEKREDLIKELLRIWDEITMDEIRDIIEHVEAVYEEVIERKGEYIRTLKKRKINTIK